jgi:tetratricopeptide (TPR) repeat protein
MKRARVLLVGWPAVDWKLLHPLLDSGAMPNLARLIGRGVIGNLTAPMPLVAPLLSTSLVTGVRAAKHGMLGEARPGVSLRDRNCPAFWDFLKPAGVATHLVNWPLTDPAEDTGGACVADSFFALSRQPRDATACQLVQPPGLAQSLTPLRIGPDEVDDATLRFFVPELDRACREDDDRLRQLARAIARTISVQAVTNWLMANRAWEVTAVCFDLLPDLLSWALPLHAPKLGAVGQLEFELYRHVLDAACGSLDLLLGPLLQAAGEESTVFLVSDHGLLLGETRPGRTPQDVLKAKTWRRREGVLVISGPACRKDEVIFGAKLLDVAPTVLAALGIAPLPVMEGRILTEAFAAPLPDEPSPAPVLWPSRLEPEFSSSEMDDAQVERLWNLVRSHVEGGEISAAFALVERLHRARPDHLEFLLGLFEGQLLLKKLAEARETLELLLDRLWGTPRAALLQARLDYVARRFDASLRHLESIPKNGPPAPRVNLQIGFNLIKLNRSAQARDYYRRELEIQPESAEAHAGLAYCCLRAGGYDEAIAYAFKAVSLNYELFYAHLILGLAHARKGETDRALAALHVVTALQPGFAPGHRCLAVLYGHDPEKQELAQHHRELAQAAVNRGWGF